MVAAERVSLLLSLVASSEVNAGAVVARPCPSAPLAVARLARVRRDFNSRSVTGRSGGRGMRAGV